MESVELRIAGEQLQLHPHRALYWQRMGWLVLSDLHLGKAAHLRKGGLAIPEGHDDHTLQRLDTVIATFRPQRIVILGDLFHSSMNVSWERFVEWAGTASAPIHLVPGNHDILADRRYAQAGVQVCDESMEEGPFLFQHDLKEAMGRTSIGGHVHPGVVLTGKGRQRIRVPAFLINEARILLPAFGTSTGLHILKPRKTDRVFACTGTAVMEVSKVLAPRSTADT